MSASKASLTRVRAALPAASVPLDLHGVWVVHFDYAAPASQHFTVRMAAISVAPQDVENKGLMALWREDLWSGFFYSCYGDLPLLSPCRLAFTHPGVCHCVGGLHREMHG